MRPVRLELQGFTSFRDAATVEFGDADLFALIGPTGAGKSSIIDAIGFALYGCVPRYDDARLVHPVINQAANEARVRFDFEAGGVPWSVVRVVRRTKGGGASTREARLERDGEVYAGDANAVTKAVESAEVLGLTFDQFTKCVVLPQGAFARFLHDEPAKRQDLLVRLLDLGLYRRVADLAHGRAARSAARAESLRERLAGELAGAGPEAVAAATRLVSDLEGLRGALDAARPRLEALAAAALEAANRADEADRRVAALAGLSVPRDVAGIAAAHAAAAATQSQAAERARAADEALRKAEAAAEGMPARVALERLAALHQQRADEVLKHTKFLRVMEQEVGPQEDSARTSHEAAERALADASGTLDAARLAHRAADLSRQLVAGMPCPVCLQNVHELPHHDAPDLDAAAAAVEAARELERAALDALRVASARRQKGEGKIADAEARIAELDARLRDEPTADEVAEALRHVEEIETALRSARAEDREARDAVVTAAEAGREAEEKVSRARRSFDATRDGLAGLDPPAPARADLAADWAALVAWGDARRVELTEKAAAARAAADAAAAERTAEESGLAELASGLGVVPRAGGTLGEACAEALASAAADVRRLQQLAAAADEARGALAAAERDAAIASSLHRHLGARHFQRWIVDEALAVLVDGATAVLRDLSGGAYSLTLDEKGGFAVVDHLNADTERSARTLSGGETFLASLALALALADRIGELATAGAPRLEAIFLDEGFGSLDPETLDTVAAAIEALASRGRAVGIVTHVRDLADRVPVRFEVEKTSAGSSVRRVET